MDKRSISSTSGSLAKTVNQQTLLNDLAMLFKFRLSTLVIFSSVVAYYAAGGNLANIVDLFLLVVGGALVTWASGSLNQVLEKETDGLMTRTMERPLVTGRITSSSAVLMAGLMAMVGIVMLSLINPIAGFLGSLSFILYAFIYTPLKSVTQISVIIGAIPGALPTAIGAVAASNEINSFVVFIFLMQFFWQFPHFWGIAWVADEDYKKAGFKMLPGLNGKKDQTTGILSLIFCIFLVVLGVFGYQEGILGIVGFAIFTVFNLLFAATALMLIKDGSNDAARRMMFASFFHLPFTLVLILLDQIW